MGMTLGGGSIGPGDDGDFEALTFQTTPNLVETLGLEIGEGPSFVELNTRMSDNVVFINRAFVEAARSDPIGWRVSTVGTQNAHVVGVVENFHARLLHHVIQPLVITLDALVKTLYVRLAPGALSEGMDRLRAVCTNPARRLRDKSDCGVRN